MVVVAEVLKKPVVVIETEVAEAAQGVADLGRVDRLFLFGAAPFFGAAADIAAAAAAAVSMAQQSVLRALALMQAQETRARR